MNADESVLIPCPGFSSIYQDHFPMVYRFGIKLLGDSEQAMDLAQEVFLKLYAALSGGPEIREIKSWLFRTAANLSYDWLRRKRRYHALLRSDIGVRETSGDVEGDFISAEDRRAVMASMERLAPRDRVLLTLYGEGLRYQEIAGAMGLRESSVGKLIARAVQRLSREFKEGERR